MSLVPIDEVVHFDVITSDPTDEGAAIDADSAPTYDVFEEGTDTPILDDQTMTKRTSLTGNYRGSFTASAANGFEAGKWYSVVVTAVVGAKTGKCVAKNFRVAPAESVAGVPKSDVHALVGVAQSATDLKDFADDGYDPGTNKVQGVVLTDTVTTYTGDTPQTGDSFARIGATGSGLTSLASQASVTTIDGIVDDILVDTAEIGAAGAGLTNINLPNQTMDIIGNITGNVSGSVGSVTGLTASNLDATISSRATPAQVNTEVDTALADIHLDHLLAATYDPASKPGVSDALLNELVESDAGVARYTANALEQAPTGGSAPTAGEIADEVRVELTTELGRLDAGVSTRATPAQVATELATYDGPTNAEMEARTLTAALIAKLTAHLNGVATVVIGSGSTTTAVVFNAATGINGSAPSAVDDHYNGRVLVFLTGTLALQATSISDYVGSTGTATVVALTSAPSAGDTAILV